MIETKHVSKVYKMGELDLEVIKDLNLTIGSGEFIAIVGPSGSGKSTVLNILGGLDTPTSGEVVVDNINITDLNTTELAHFRGEKIGFIFQSFNLIPVLSVYENIEYPLIMIQHLPPQEREKRVLEVLKEVDMLDQKESPSPEHWSPTQRSFLQMNPQPTLTVKPHIVSSNSCTRSNKTTTQRLSLPHMMKR
jgi:putative ABC transport system ATP-binding protein